MLTDKQYAVGMLFKNSSSDKMYPDFGSLYLQLRFFQKSYGQNKINMIFHDVSVKKVLVEI